MSRSPVHVRGVRLEDAADLLDLWQLPMRPSTLRADALAELQAGIRKVLATDRERIVLAECDGDVAGALHLRVAPLAPLTTICTWSRRSVAAASAARCWRARCPGPRSAGSRTW